MVVNERGTLRSHGDGGADSEAVAGGPEAASGGALADDIGNGARLQWQWPLRVPGDRSRGVSLFGVVISPHVSRRAYRGRGTTN